MAGKTTTIAVDVETHALLVEFMHQRRAANRGAAVRLAVMTAMDAADA